MKTIEYHSEDVTITHSTYGVDDHGILTCTVFCEWDGDGQGFGNLCLDERTGPAFVHDLCEFFGVAANPGEEQAALDERRDLDAARREADKTIGRIVRERDEVIARLNKAHDEKEVARLRDELAVERQRYAFAAAHWGAADIDALRAERDAARAMLTPRVYKEGDRPRLPEMVLYRSEGVWAPLHCDCLRPGDLWIPMPPPPDEDKR